MTDSAAHQSDLGIVPHAERLSVEACLRRGTWRVSGPVYTIMLGGIGITFLLNPFDILRGMHNSQIGAAALLPVISWPVWVAWLYWSAMVPKWRVRALQTVDDWASLEARAVAGLLIWPRDSIFERTEIKTTERRNLEIALLRYRDQRG